MKVVCLIHWKHSNEGKIKRIFEIMPREPMTLDAYTEALAKIVAN